MSNFWRHIILIALLADTASPLVAAEFRFSPEANDCQIKLDGNIERGDLTKLKTKLPDGLWPARAGPTMCLNSPGGDFIEGLQLAQFVSGGIATDIQAGSSCESACGWIFMAGTASNTDGSEWSRTMDARATLSFHGPFIDPSSLAGINEQIGSGPKAIIQAYNQAVSQLASGLLNLAQQRASITAEVLVPPTLLAEALTKVGDQKLLVNTTGSAIRWSIDVHGYAGIVPHSKKDVIQACVVGSAFGNAFWNDEYTSITEAEEYEAYYDSHSHTLVVETIVQGLAQIACEIEFVFDENLSRLKDGHFNITINVGTDESVTRGWIRDRYASKEMQLPDFAVLSSKTLLNHLAAMPRASLNPSSLATLSTPSWCNSQPVKTSDEETVCENPKLTTYDILLNRYYNEAIVAADSQGKEKLRSEERAWLNKRRLCNDDERCLEQAYHSRISGLKEDLGSP